MTRKISDGPGLTAVRMATAAGDIAITRPDGLLAYYAVPGQPERLVALKRRDYTELISEELRRMDADEVYERAVKSLLDGDKQDNQQTVRRQEGTSEQAGARRPEGHEGDRQDAQSQKQTAWSRLDGRDQPRDLAPCRTG